MLEVGQGPQDNLKHQEHPMQQRILEERILEEEKKPKKSKKAFQPMRKRFSKYKGKTKATQRPYNSDLIK